jgi:hypothetical protein
VSQFTRMREDFYIYFCKDTLNIQNTCLSVISTHKTVIFSRKAWFLRAKCDFYTQSVIYTRTSLIFSRRVWCWHAKCNVDMKSVTSKQTSVITRGSSVIFPCRVRFSHAKVWFIHTECAFYTNSVISTRIVWLLHIRCNFHKHECDFNTLEWFMHAECDLKKFDTQTFENEMFACKIHTHSCWLVNIIFKDTLIFQNTHPSAISTRTILHVECDFYMQGLIVT